MTQQKSDPSSDEGVPCVFPFKYQGVRYDHCTSAGHPGNKTWCSTGVDRRGYHLAGKGRWGVCGKNCPQSLDCPPGWTNLSTGCYAFDMILGGEDGIEMENAEKICQEFGGYLLEINSREEQEEVARYLNEQKSNKCLFQVEVYWLGMTDRDQPGEWVYSRSGDTMGWQDWYERDQVSRVGENCAALVVDAYLANDLQKVENLFWFQDKCTKTKYSWKEKKVDVLFKGICERDTNYKPEIIDDVKETPTLESEECLEGWTKLSTGCYLFEPRPSTFREAKSFCQRSGGYLAEINSKQEFAALESAWQNLSSNLTCQSVSPAWWIGLTDRKIEGVWVWDYSGTKPTFLAWSEGQPNNQGGKTPGEDCTVANFEPSKRTFKWFDIPCSMRGFPITQGQGVTFNPLCEQLMMNTEINQKGKNCDGCQEEWIKLETGSYKFIEDMEGTTKDEAQDICMENGGHLVYIENEIEQKTLNKYLTENYKKTPISSLLPNILASFFGGEKIRNAGWWIGATFDEEENHWVWENSNKLLGFTNWNIHSANRAAMKKCAGVFEKKDLVEMILKGYLYDDGHRNKNSLGINGEDFEWADVFCHQREFGDLNIRMNTICEK